MTGVLALPAGSLANGGIAAQPLPLVRQTVRDLLLSSAAYHALPADERREISQSLVRVCHTAVGLLEEEARSLPRAGIAPADSRRWPLAQAQSAGSDFSGVSAQRVAGTTRAILNAVSFPRFVTELINGVFKALVDSNQQQMQSFVELIKNVAATTEDFADTNLAPQRARQWLIDTFPGSFELEGGPDEDTDPRDVAEEAQEARLRLRSGASMPPEPVLRSSLGMDPGESVPTGDPETSLVPFARRALARQRQQMLASMVMLGMQRIVIESGRLNASMRFHIDTRSAAAADEASRLDIQNRLESSGRIGAGPWGVEAKMTNTIGYVSTQKTQTTEEMNTDLELNSGVELYFKTDYMPLDRLAGKGQVDRIKVNTLNPDAEEAASRKSREARTTEVRTAEGQRRAALQTELVRPAPAEGGSGSTGTQPRSQTGQPSTTSTTGSTTGQPSTGSTTGSTTSQPPTTSTTGSTTTSPTGTATSPQSSPTPPTTTARPNQGQRPPPPPSQSHAQLPAGQRT